MNFKTHLLVLGMAFAIHVGAAPAPAPDRDAQYYSEQMSLESARYLFDTEGDTAAAHTLLDRLQQSHNEEIRTQAQYLRGRFLENKGKAQDVIHAYTQALGGRGLSVPEKRQLVTRLMTLNPGAIQPLSLAGKARGLPSQVFSSPEGPATRYVMVEESDNPESAPPRVSMQDAEGLLHPMKVDLNPGEEILDATPNALLVLMRNKQQVSLRKAPAFNAVPASEKFVAEEGLLFSADAEEFLLIGTQGLRLVRHGQTVFSRTLPGPGCSYRPSSPRSRQGVVFCPGHGIYRADFSRRSLSALALGGDAPSEVSLSGEYLALRYVDHIEIRRGPSFDAFLWGFPSGMQDQLTLGRDHAFLIGSQGQLRAFNLRTGQLDWQREDDIAEVIPAGGEVFALTHDQTCLALDEKGQTLFTYEAGWGADPLLLPTQNWLVVQQADGHRVRLNRDLLRITGGDREYLFRDVDEDLKQHDAAGALNQLNTILTLEPGNGTAWREKAQILRTLEAPKKEQTVALQQASRSQTVAPWTNDATLHNLAHSLGASWIWKRHSGPRFFPTLTAGRRFSFYVENDNQTLVLLDNETGAFHNSFHFQEPLDLKAACWFGDTVVVSSPTRLYLLAPSQAAGILAQIPLRNPICQAIPVPGGIVYSDWSGGLQFIDLPSRRVRWEQHLGRSGLLLSHGHNTDQLDVFEIEGGYHGIKLSSGQSFAQVNLPPGTITECYSGRDLAFAGYNEGVILAVDRNRGNIVWQKDMGEQIFSLSGKNDNLLIGTASKRLLVIQGQTGAMQAQTRLPTYLFNRPLMVDDGYWIGTTEPALEKRSLNHALLQRLPLTDMPGTPSLVGGGIGISTLDHFIIRFPVR